MSSRSTGATISSNMTRAVTTGRSSGAATADKSPQAALYRAQDKAQQTAQALKNYVASHGPTSLNSPEGIRLIAADDTARAAMATAAKRSATATARPPRDTAKMGSITKAYAERMGGYQVEEAARAVARSLGEDLPREALRTKAATVAYLVSKTKGNAEATQAAMRDPAARSHHGNRQSADTPR